MPQLMLGGQTCLVSCSEAFCRVELVIDGGRRSFDDTLGRVGEEEPSSRSPTTLEFP